MSCWATPLWILYGEALIRRAMKKRAGALRDYSAIFILILITAGLRFAQLDAQSFWNDEGNTARLVERPIQLLIEGAAGDVHPPGYYLILALWRQAVGETEFALRSYSAFCGILSVAITSALIRKLSSGKPKTLFLSLGPLCFAVLHPLAVYYSQEARMYAQLGLAVINLLWATVLFQEIWSIPVARPGDRKRVYRTIYLVVSVAFGLYTHYAFVFALISLSLAYGLYWLVHNRHQWLSLVMWVVACALGGSLFLPWAPVAIRAGGWQPPDLGSTEALSSMARALVVGVTLPEIQARYVVPVLAGLSLLALISLPHAKFISWGSFTMAYIPAVLIAVLGIYRPAYLKFLIISIFPLAVSLAALLIDWISTLCNRRLVRVYRTLACVGLLLLQLALLAAQLQSLPHLYSNPAYARDDYRSLAEFIRSDAQPGDAVVLNAPNQWEVFTYYYRGEIPVYTAPYRPKFTEASAWVKTVVENHNQLFVLYWGDVEADPERAVESALARQAFKAGEVWVSTVRLARYGSGMTGKPVELDDVVVGDFFNLVAYSLPDSAYTRREIVPLTLIWSARKQSPERFKVFVHLVDDAGNLVAQADSEPVGGLYLTSQWTVGEEVKDKYGILLPTKTNPGDYTVLVGMYAYSGNRLQVSQNGEAVGDYLRLGTITVE
ncbi:MAG: glycosyltransferase family 39 protein [Anaerolineae bacterium]|nr:glycosyltransferase family 39 protein [Anaerolineae bacterium]